MPGHLISHKWAKLIDPHNRMPFIKGYLKFDLYILAPGETLQLPTQPKESDESIERNLLFEAAGRNLEAQAKYVVKVYKGEFKMKVLSYFKISRDLKRKSKKIIKNLLNLFSSNKFLKVKRLIAFHLYLYFR